MVINGHPGAVRRGIDYDTVFAAAPHLQSARILRALEVLLDWTPADFDIVQTVPALFRLLTLGANYQ